MLNRIGAYNGIKNKKVYELALVKKEVSQGAKNVKMAPTKKERCFFHCYIEISTNYSLSSLKVGISVT